MDWFLEDTNFRHKELNYLPKGVAEVYSEPLCIKHLR